MNQNAFDFISFNQFLSQSGAKMDAAQTHALLSGLICSGSHLEPATMQSILSTSASSDESDMLVHLYQSTADALGDIELNFNLLLPSDDESLDVRALSLSHWCEYFLRGLKYGGVEHESVSDHEVQEILVQFTEFAEINYDALEMTESDEVAFAEIVEYVRVAVLLVYTELNRRNESGESVLH